MQEIWPQRSTYKLGYKENPFNIKEEIKINYNNQMIEWLNGRKIINAIKNQKSKRTSRAWLDG